MPGQDQMIRQLPHRPSLKITRIPGQRRERSFTFEVWSPFTSDYQAEDSIEDAVRRVNQLASLIFEMSRRRHPGQDALTDTPAPDSDNTDEWAEFRINATAYRSYDTRRHNKLDWTRSGSLIQAVETTCVRVGCVPPASSPP
jgi:hypothetical protein